ncbi:MAG TPA: DUF4034 domain-containing protein [Blastocatellia bacterium]
MIAKSRGILVLALFLAQVLVLPVVARQTGQSSESGSPCPTTVTAASELPAATLEQIQHGGELDSVGNYEADIRSKLMASGFGELDLLAEYLRSSKERFPGGAWKLDKFYAGLGVPRYGSGSPDSDWLPQLEKLRQWAAQEPDSLTAHIALALGMVHSAWRARTGNFAKDVKADSWPVFYSRLNEARNILNSIAANRASDPQWFATMIQIAMGQNWNQAQFSQTFEEAISIEPLYTRTYITAATFLLPRWHGKAGDDANLMFEARQRLGGKEGSALYYFIGDSVAGYYSGRAVVTDAKVCWEWMKQGYLDAESLYGSSLLQMNTMAKRLGEFDEKPMSKWLFTRIGDRWASNIWHEKQFFERVRDWAFSTGS